MNSQEFEASLEQMKMHCGLIADLTKRLKDISPQFGKTVLQKMVFLLQEVYHVNVGYSFGFHTFGPFSSDLLGDLDIAENSGVVVVNTGEGAYGHGYVIKPGERIEACLTDAGEFLKANSQHISDLVSAFGGKSAKELELLTTIIYLNKEIQLDVDKMTRDEAISKIRELKPKFTESEVLKGMTELKATYKIQLVFLREAKNLEVLIGGRHCGV
jgi:uncharacterized protein YwgA